MGFNGGVADLTYVQTNQIYTLISRTITVDNGNERGGRNSVCSPHCNLLLPVSSVLLPACQATRHQAVAQIPGQQSNAS